LRVCPHTARCVIPDEARCLIAWRLPNKAPHRRIGALVGKWSPPVLATKQP
jgi:hypothetical protein